VRVYRNYENDQSPMELVTSFRALNDRIKVKRGSGMVLDWQQSNGILLASGDVRIVRVWDAHRELCLQVRDKASSRSSVLNLFAAPRTSLHMLQVA
jgi:regulatory associated protein of mTOR